MILFLIKCLWVFDADILTGLNSFLLQKQPHKMIKCFKSDWKIIIPLPQANFSLKIWRTLSMSMRTTKVEIECVIPKFICKFNSFLRTKFLRTECARDRDLYKLVSRGKLVNEKLFRTIYKTYYLTFGHHALSWDFVLVP